MKVYFASKTKHAIRWRSIRSSGVQVIATWIDEAEAGETVSPAELAQRCIAEVKECDVVLLYIGEGDEPKGAFIEAGAALAFGKPVRIVAPTYRVGIFVNHPLVSQFPTVAAALGHKPSCYPRK